MENPIQAEIILYQSEGTNVPVQVYYKDETLWVSQAAMAELFDVTVPTISAHLKNIYESGELQKASSTSFLEIFEKTSKGGRPKTKQADSGGQEHSGCVSLSSALENR